MKTPLTLKRWIDTIVSPTADPAVAAALEAQRQHAPVLWLLGKTGAGKSSIVQRLTGDSRVVVGNGFTPCTASAALYEHPREQPVMRFLDTRGLGEPDYDPHADLAACHDASHALLLVMRLDEPVQQDLLEALGRLGGSLDDLPTLVIHTALHTVSDADTRDRVMRHQQVAVSQLFARPPPAVAIDFTDPVDGFPDPDWGLELLIDAIIELVPTLATVLRQEAVENAEQGAFVASRREVLAYAGAAGAVDLLPGVGLVAVPGLQGKLLHSLAQRYAVPWDRRMAREFLAALGTSFLYRYGLSLAGRQLGKLVPVYGQTAGAAAAASVSFASTYALGRAACLYLFRRRHHQPIEPEVLRDAFRQAFSEQRHKRAARNEET